MAIYITGDTHGDFRRFRPDIFPEQNSMTKEDLAPDMRRFWRDLVR